MSKFLRYTLLALLLVSGLFAAGVWSGFYVADALDTRSSIPYRAKVRLVGYYNSLFRQDAPADRTIPTIHLTLKEKTVFMPLDVADFAGGISAVDGSSVLILDRLGTLVHVDGDSVTLVGVAPPDNHVAALHAQVDEGQFGDSEVDFKWFRYNDILHVRDQGRAWLLASYTDWNAEDFCFTSALARLEVPADAPPQTWTAKTDDWTVVARTRPCLAPFDRAVSRNAIKGLEAGGRLALRGGTTVIWTSGSYERDDFYKDTDFSRALAQDDATDYGKVLEVDFMTGAMRTIAKGLRNPQGLAIGEDGRIWVTDHGMRGGDELNLVFEGANFGYPAVTYGTHYDKQPAGNRDRHAGHAGYDLPAIAFVPSIAPGSAAVARNFHYSWDGDILIGAFRGLIYRVHIEGDRAMFAEPVEIEVRPRDMVMLDDGQFAVWTDDRRLVFFSAETGPDPVARLRENIAALTPGPLRDSVSGAFDGCLQCHSLAEGENAAGPSLYKVCGRETASTDFDSYSDALQGLGGKWNAGRLAEFIADPQSVAPGTGMAWSGMDGAAATVLSGLLCEGGM